MNRNLSSSAAAALRAVLLLGLLLVGGGAALAAGEAGQVIFVKGEAARIGADGRREALAMGTLIYPGDTVVTTDGTAQIRFTDKGLVALIARSRFVVNEYIYKGRTDGAEKGFFSMLAGGLRAITGQIGKQNHAAYRLSANAATIGIRGTSFQARVCQKDCAADEADGLYVTGGEGAIAVTNAVGEVVLTRGMSAYVRDNQTAPVITQRFPGVLVVKPPETEIDPSQSTAQLATQSQYWSSYTIPQETLLVTIGAGLPPTYNGIIDAISNPLSGNIGGVAFPPIIGNATFSPNGNTVGFTTASLNVQANGVGQDVQSDGLLYLGRWTNGTVTATLTSLGTTTTQSGTATGNQSIHWVTGVPITQNPISGQATYNLTMTTRSTGSDGSIGQGLLAGSQLSADFGARTVGANLIVGHNGTYQGQATTQMSSSAPVLSFVGTGTATGPQCTGSACGFFVDGFFSGTGQTGLPRGAGLNYSIGTPAAQIVGAGGFRCPNC
jgi:hypothetical protein